MDVFREVDQVEVVPGCFNELGDCVCCGEMAGRSGG